MKYKFVYDKDFLENRFFELNYDEVEVIRAIICGGHHALLYGYRPERLLNAIQLLTRESRPQQKPDPNVSIELFCGGEDLPKGCVSLADGGFLFMENLHKFRYSIICMATSCMDIGSIRLSRAGELVNYPTHFQLVATTKDCQCGNYKSTQNPCLCSAESVTEWWKRMDNIVKRCDIIYCCTDSPEISRTLVPIKAIKECLQKDWNSHQYEMGTTTKNCEISCIDDLSFTDEAGTIFHGAIADNPIYNPVRLARLARTVADIHEHCMIRVADVKTAINWYQRIR